MKKMEIFWILFLVLMVLQSHGREIESQIKRVTLYPSLAMVQREAAVKLSGGEIYLEFTRLPARLLDESVQVRLINVEGVAITNVQVERWFLERPEERNVKMLETEIEEWRRKDKALEDEIKSLQVQEEFIKSIKVNTAEKASQLLTTGKSDALAWSNSLNFIAEKLDKIYNRMAEIEFKRQEVTDRVEVLKKQLDKVRSAKPEEEKTISVWLRASNALTTRLVLSYLVPDVSWSASYEIRALPDDEKIELIYAGFVRQKTGEDWKNVELSLSTADPVRGARVPELRPWNLSLIQARPLGAGSGLMKKMQAPPVPAQVLDTAGLEEESLVMEYSQAEARGVSVVFNISGQYEIPSGGDPARLTIMRRSFEAPMSYVAVPKLSQHVFLKSNFTNESDYPFLAGQALVYVQGDYVGKSWMENMAPGEKMDLSLGADENLHIKHELVKKFERSTGLLSKKVELEYQYKITLENYKDKPAQIEIMDQVPRTLHESIKVDEISTEPNVTETNKDTGELKWKLQIQPKEKKELHLQFTISYPRGASVSGLF